MYLIFKNLNNDVQELFISYHKIPKNIWFFWYWYFLLSLWLLVEHGSWQSKQEERFFVNVSSWPSFHHLS